MNTIATDTTVVDVKPVRLLPAKLRAAFIHIGISVVILFVFLYLILVNWYPEPFFSTDGGWNGIQIMLFVDMVLGPALTFIIFNPRKSRKEILVDLSIIAIVQISALAWGGLTVYKQRPIAVVEWGGTLWPLTQDPLHQQAKVVGDLEQFGSEPRPIIRAEPPKDEQGRMKAMELALNKDLSEAQQFWLFQPFKESFAEVRQHALNISAVTRAHVEIGSALEQFLSQNTGKKADEFIYLKFSGRYKDAILIFDVSGNQVGAITWGAPARLVEG